MKRKSRGNQTRRTTEEWQKILKDHSGSGMSEKGFCSDRGICLSSFRRWREILESKSKSKSKSKKASSKFVTFDVLTSPTFNCQAELVLPHGIVIRLGESTALPCIRELLSSVKEA